MNTEHEPKKIFTLQPSENPMTALILGARDALVLDTALDHGAARCGVWLLDLCVRGDSYEWFGAVAISDGYIARKLAVSSRTVGHWKRQLEGRHFWFSAKFTPNTWPMTIWHARALDVPRQEGRTTREGFWGGGALRGNPLPRGNPESKGVESTQVLDTTSDNGNPLPPSAETHFRGQRKPTSAGSGNPLPRAAETHFRGQRKPTSAGSGNPLPRTAEAGFSHKEAKAGEKAVLKASPERSTGELNALERRRRVLEKRFLAEVGEVMDGWRSGAGRVELSSSGAWWRLAYRADADLITRVLSETQAMVKGGRIEQTPGAAAVDLWQRWGGKLPEVRA